MKVVVLLSGGLDSATCLGLACDLYGKENVKALSVIYGQKHVKEIECAKKLAEHYGVPRYEIDISNVMQYSNCSLLKHSSKSLEHTAYVEQVKEKKGAPVDSYVPFRNGLMLSIAGSLALSLFDNSDDKILLAYGAHADDAAGNAYPDCSFKFVTHMGTALSEGSGDKLTLWAPFVSFNKAAIVAVGRELGVPYELTWSCYEGGEKACGTCGTCRDRIAAFKANGMEDPIEYENANN